MVSIIKRWKIRSTAIASMLVVFSGSCGANSEMDKRVSGNKFASHYLVQIPSLNAAEALTLLAEQTKAQFMFPYDLAESRPGHPVVGKYTIMEALKIILQDSGLASDLSKKGVIEIYVVDDLLNSNERRGSMNTKENILASTIAFLMMAGVQQGHTGEGTKQVEWLLEEVVVTAQKREQLLSDVPMSITAMSSEELENRGITNIQDLSFSVPGMHVFEGGAQGRNVTLRGVGNVFGARTIVGTNLDEVPLGSARNQVPDLRVHDLERVEVLRGPQGTLYGDGSIGGTVKFITKDPQLNTISSALDISTSLTKDGSPTNEVAGVINIPIIEDELAVRFSGTLLNGGGWVDQPERSLKDFDDQELMNIRTKVLWQPNDAFKAVLMALVYQNDSNAGFLRLGDGSYVSPAIAPPSTPRYERDYTIFNATLSYDFGAVTLVSSTSQFDTDLKRTNWGGYLPLFPAPAIAFEYYLSSSDNSVESFSQELRLSSNNSDIFNWTIGAFYNDFTEIDGGTGQTYLWGQAGQNNTITLPLDNRNSSASWALFGEASYTIGRFEVGAGMRKYRDDAELGNEAGATFQSETFDTLNPRFYARYEASDDIKLYTSATKGFRSGGFNALGSPAFDPEELWTYELGGKLSFLDGRLKTDLAVFFSDYSRVQIVGVVGGVNITSNAGDAEIKGIEWAVNALPTENFLLGFTGSVLDAEIVALGAASSSHQIGDPLDFVPDYTFTLSADYGFHWSDEIAGFARVDFSKIGKSTYRNRQIGLHYFSESDVLELLNAKLSAEKGSWQVDLFVNNLLDERGYTSPVSIERGGVPARPRTVGVNVGFDF